MKKHHFSKGHFAWIVTLALLNGCYPKESRRASAKKMVLTDDLGRRVEVPVPARRVMALAPSLTEILFFVCDTAEVVAVTPNDNFPAVVQQKPVVSSYPLDFEGVLLRKPDLIFTKDGMTAPADAERLQRMGIPVYYQTYETVEDVLTGILDVAQLTGHTDRVRTKVDSLRQRLQTLEQQTRHWPKPRVLAITWPDPIYAYGKNTLLTDKLRLAGATNAIDSVFNVPYPTLSREYILRLNPDIILGGSFEKMDTTFFKLYPELKKTAAYRHKRVYQVTDDLNSRPSPRVVEAVEELRRLTHPAQ